jgi:flagellar biogenesis protein FliO
MSPEPSGQPSVLLRKRLFYCLFGVGIVALGLATPLLVEGGRSQDLPAQVATEGATPLEGPEMGGMLVRLVGGTVVVLLLCVAILWICRRWWGVKSGTAAPGIGLEVLESLTLTGFCRLDLVRAGERYLLAGMDASGLKVVIAVEGTVDEGDNLTNAASTQTSPQAA